MCNRNVSETAKQLNMHRRSLQRILAKRRRDQAFRSPRHDSKKPAVEYRKIPGMCGTPVTSMPSDVLLV
jgi:hypothetical protein